MLAGKSGICWNCSIASCRVPSRDRSAYRERLGDSIGCEFLAWPIGTPSFTPVGLEYPGISCWLHRLGCDFNTEGIINFCTRILPLILQEVPNFRCLIAGEVIEPLLLLEQSWPGYQWNRASKM